MRSFFTERRFARSGWLAVLVLLPALNLLAAGKIAGRVTDQAGESLIGVNVTIEGTLQGTTTNENGDYVLVNVQPGTHTLVFSYIGFQTQRMTDVRVVTDQTTRIDVALGEEVIQGQEIVVQAERPLVQKDLTASRRTVVSEEIETLPVEGFLGVLTTQAGVTQGAGGELHIRGGRSNEIAYLVDGLSVANPFNTNGLATEVATNAIQEMTVVSGAFNAEYGNAMSGIVNVVTKDGGDEYEGSVSLYGGDTFTTHRDVFFTPSGVGADVYTLEGVLSGPVPVYRRLKFFFSGRRDVSEGYIYGIREHLPSDSADFRATPWYYEIHGRPWTAYGDSLRVPSERVPMNPSESYNLLAKLSLRPFPGAKLEYTHLRDGAWRKPLTAESGGSNFAYRYNPDGIASNRDESTNHGLFWTHTLDARTFYTLRLSLAEHGFNSYLYADTTDLRYVSEGRIIGFPGLNFLMGGNDRTHVYEDSRSFRGKLDLTRQFGTVHEAKLGVDWRLHALDRENFEILYDGNQYRKPTVLPAESSPSHDRYTNQRVVEWSAYAQDKLEFENFIINAGLRFDRFDPQGTYVADLLNPWADRQTRTIAREEARPKNMLSPRLGVSFPITARGIIHFSYGHFYQMPSLRNLYLNPEFEFGAGETPVFGNANLRPERTVLYEIGLQQQIGELLAFDLTGFFKDIRDYLARQIVQFSTIPGENRYEVYLNKDYANVKGITLALTKRRARSGLLSANIDYTYQIAEGNRTDPGAFFFNFLSGRENELEIVPLDFDQRHVLSSTISLTRPNSWGLSVIGQFATGYPYSPVLYTQNLDLLPNTGRKPNQIKLDAHLFKAFALGSLNVTGFVKVYNVLDRLNERFVFDDTGRATYSLAEQRNLHAAWKPFYGLPGVHTLAEYNTRPHWYSRPREVRVGLTLAF